MPRLLLTVTASTSRSTMLEAPEHVLARANLLWIAQNLENA
jgi:hypothetical protein